MSWKFVYYETIKREDDTSRIHYVMEMRKNNFPSEAMEITSEGLLYRVVYYESIKRELFKDKMNGYSES